MNFSKYADSFRNDILYFFDLHDQKKKVWKYLLKYILSKNFIKQSIQLYKMFSHIVACLDESIFLISFALTRTPASPGQTQNIIKLVFFSLQP